MATDAPTPLAEPNAFELEADLRLEVLMDELLASEDSPRALPADFTARLMAERPYAPWEVRRASGWKVPAGVAGGLLLGSAALFLAPLSHLGAQASAQLWGHLVAAALGRPLATFASSWSVLAEAASRVGNLLPGSLAALAALGSAGGGLVLMYALRGRKAVVDEGVR